VCVVEIFTAPAVRARGQGLTRSIGFIACWNAPSLRIGQVTTGRTVEGTVGYLRRGPWQRHFATGAVRFTGDGEVEVQARAAGRDRAQPSPALHPRRA
jgi:hypothetical protein